MMKSTRKLKKTEVIVNNRIWTKLDLQALIQSNETALMKGMLRIYDKQTRAEQVDQDTREWNEVGFSGADGYIMSNMAEFYQKRGYVSPKQKELIQKKMKKYCGQLLKLMAEDNYEQNRHFFKTKGQENE